MDALTPQQILARIRYDTDSQRGSVLDVVQLVTGCAQANASRDLQRILEVHPDLRPKMKDLKFNGRGQRPTPVAPLPVLIEIAWLCPGRHAQAFRRTGARTLCRALGGDLSLVDEIKARHEEVAGTDEQAALLAGTGVSTAEANGQAMAPNPEFTALDLEERRARIERMKIENMQMQMRMQMDAKMQEQEAARGALALADDLEARAKRETDERQRLFLNDQAKNVVRIYMPGAQRLALHDATEHDNEPLMLTDVVVSMGAKPSPTLLQAAGRAAAQLFRREHGRDPPKHNQLVNGAVRPVNTYFERDRSMLERAVREAQNTHP